MDIAKLIDDILANINSRKKFMGTWIDLRKGGEIVIVTSYSQHKCSHALLSFIRLSRWHSNVNVT